MRKIIILIFVLSCGYELKSQPPDTLKTNERKVQWLAGVDALSALNVVSVIGSLESNRSRYSLSLSYMFGSTRIGVYYDYYISKKYRVLGGIGFHNSFLFNKFKQSRSEYIDSLVENKTQARLSDIAFIPNGGEVRHLYFLSAYLSKEFRLYRELYTNIKICLVYGMNTYYHVTEFSPMIGLQLYYKF